MWISGIMEDKYYEVGTEVIVNGHIGGRKFENSIGFIKKTKSSHNNIDYLVEFYNRCDLHNGECEYSESVCNLYYIKHNQLKPHYKCTDKKVTTKKTIKGVDVYNINIYI